jgi:hypothetical protein
LEDQVLACKQYDNAFQKLIATLVKKHGFSSCSSWLISFLLQMKCPFWLEVHCMNGHCSYWLIDLINDDALDYLPNGTSSQVETKMIFLFNYDG